MLDGRQRRDSPTADVTSVAKRGNATPGTDIGHLGPGSPAPKNVPRSIFDAIANALSILLFQRDKSRGRLSQSLGKGICGKEVNRYRTGRVSRRIPELDHMPVRHLQPAGW